MKYIIFNKPFNILSQFKEVEGKENLKNFINLKEKPKAVGRLDFDSEGLLILTNDIEFSNYITHPANKIEKEYHVQVEGSPTEKDLQPIFLGIQTNSEFYKPAKAELITEPNYLWERTPPIRFRKNIPTSWLKLILREGKNRQVRKMTAFIKFPTLRLVRYRIGKITIDDLKPGEWREVSWRDIC
jgi:23S rRNA pseudouridine2457 synthase